MSEAPAVPRPRGVTFEWPTELPLVWTPAAPELSLVASAVSLLMPSVEPWFVRTVRDAASTLDRDDPGQAALAERADAYVRQEGAHHRQHRRFNQHLTERRGGVGRIERWMATTVAALERRLSPRTAVALTAGAEAVAYGAARWVEPRMGTVFRGADPTATSLFLWHLAEEVEHKEVAYDVFAATDGSRTRYALGTALALVLLGWFTVLGTLTLMASAGRIWRPTAHLRLAAWSLSFAFATLPVLAASVMPGSHPSDLADPSWYRIWLAGHDATGDPAPEWVPPGSARPGPPSHADPSPPPGSTGNGNTAPPGPVRARDR